MKQTTLRFRGRRIDADELASEIDGMEGTEQLKVESSPSTGGVMGRQPLNQFELVDVVVSFLVSVAGRLTSDQIRDAIKERAKKRKLEELPASPVETKSAVPVNPSAPDSTQ